MITLTINEKQTSVADGTTVAAAIPASGHFAFKLSVNGSPRGPLCGMGVCFECGVTIDGVRHQRSCTMLAVDGMKVDTDE